MNRDHYERIKWTIGSIFIATAFTLFGITFVEEIGQDILVVTLLGCISVGLLLIWRAYATYVDFFVKSSLERLWQIEERLQQMNRFTAPILHTSIKAKKRKIRGRYIGYSFVLMVVILWVSRIVLLWVVHEPTAPWV